MKSKLKLYTDGSILQMKNFLYVENVASHGFIIVQRNAAGDDDEITRDVTVVKNTTITEMEIRAIKTGIQACIAHAEERRSSELAIEVYSDSKTAVDAFNDHMAKWIKNAIRTGGEWRATNGNPVAHQGLYKEILALIESHNVKFIHVKAHKESRWNNEVDKMVREAAKAHVESKLPLAA